MEKDNKETREEELAEELSVCDLIHEEMEEQYHVSGLTYMKPDPDDEQESAK
ncbi:hypothetical protein [Lihuaxuella thermophila]|uniref:Uncharacterized protein n=1 Tax=Lihuaxuella thermophila TaxID=1173111 RepID=A0A1H8EMU1_9BACL|nr:hypothetical protein [Lihuaxuella thermophila]SEN20700.1 hypothetical protein SAMN05444955_10771 [Lihuaxuella thermophila]